MMVIVVIDPMYLYFLPTLKRANSKAFSKETIKRYVYILELE